MTASAVNVDSPSSPLIRLLAREPEPARLLAALHQSACDLTGAPVSVLLRPSPSGERWIASSAAGLGELPLDGWLEDDAGAAAVGRALAADAPLAIGDAAQAVPRLAARLGGAVSVVIVGTGALAFGVIHGKKDASGPPATSASVM